MQKKVYRRRTVRCWWCVDRVTMVAMDWSVQDISKCL